MLLLLLLSFGLSFVFGIFFLSYLREKVGQPILRYTSEEHQKKSGTPTMGGLSFLAAIVTTLVAYGTYHSNENGFLLVVFMIIFGFGGIGFIDDYLKVTKKNNEKGLSPLQKLMLQIVISLIVILFFTKSNHETIISFLSFEIDLGIFYYLLVPFFFVGFSNATNITDGLDGLLSSVSIIIFSTISIIAISMNEIDSAALALIVSGSLFAFFLKNKNPAKMFMGDTGSLVLGALFVFLIINLNMEILGLVLGLIYVLETMSVIIQVSYFKYTKKFQGEGKRFFKIAPYHHHLEAKGYSETKVVALAVSVQIILSFIVLQILK